MVLLAYLSLVSCRSPQQVIQIVESNTHDTIVMVDVKFDSIYNTDSVYEYVYIKGDTIIRDKLKYVVKYKYSTKHDSIYVNKTDTIVQPVMVEKNLTKWQELKLKCGDYLMAFSILAFLALFVLLLYKLRGKLSS